MNTEKTFLHLEDLGETINVEISGKGSDLIDLLCQAMDSDPTVRQLVELSLMAVIAKEMEDNEDESLVDVLSKMKMGEA